MSATTSRRALIVYESMFGNTERIARAVSQVLQVEGFTVGMSEVTTAPLEVPPDIDLLVLGAPTHAFSLSRESTRAEAVGKGAPRARQATGLREWLTSAELPSRGRPIGVGIFDTRASRVRLLPKAAASGAAHLARHRGLRLLSKPIGFAVVDITGPLADGELERAAEWGRHLAGLVTRRLVSEVVQRR